MKNVFIKALLAGFIVSITASASPGDVGDIPFSFTSDGGTVTNNGIGVFPLFMNNPSIPEIRSIELLLLGLTTNSSADLDIYLLDPFGMMTLEIMTDRGGNVSLVGANLTFSADGVALPDDPNPLVSGLDYRPEGAAGFAQYVGGSGGTDAWILLLIDDGGSAGGASLDSFVLSGTYVPEPATLALMGLGAIVLLRRKRR